MNDEKTKNLDLAISQIEKQHGKRVHHPAGGTGTFSSRSASFPRARFPSTRPWALADFRADA